MEEDSVPSGEEGEFRINTTKKRKITGRMSDVRKKLLASSHETGPDCHCARLKCFETIDKSGRKYIIDNFNNLTVNEQNSYLAGLIIVLPVAQRRSRQPEEYARLNQCSYSYRVRVKEGNSVEEVPVCFKAFCSLHGISKKKVEIIQTYLKKGSSTNDGRGKHMNRKHKMSKEIFDAVHSHIASFKDKGEYSHYSLKDSKKTYLSPELNINKMYRLYKEKFPNHKVSYEKYRTIFNEKFNISFGYPRKDTCSTCDLYTAEVRAIESGLKIFPESSNENLEAKKKLKKLSEQNKLHLLKANMFYVRKRASRLASQKTSERESIAMDFQKNLPTPNITTNDVYYKRQLTVIMFNIHVLSTGDSYFYGYDETVAGKGANEVSSFLFHFVMCKLDPAVKELDIFCDSCGGQNKNWTLFRMVHYLVHHVRRLVKVKMHFPIRGHSYLECDRNMSNINQTKWIELPNDWFDEFESSRVKPSPFVVIKVDKELVRKWTEQFNKLYSNKCPFKSRPVRELVATKNHPRLLQHRTTFHGHWDGHVVNQPGSLPQEEDVLPQGEFLLPDPAYKGKLNRKLSLMIINFFNQTR